VVGRQSAVSQFNVSAEKEAAFRSLGVTIYAALQLPADVVRLSIIVQDTESGRIGSLTALPPPGAPKPGMDSITSEPGIAAPILAESSWKA